MNLRVFVVDDDWFCRKLYHQHLLNLGFRDVHLFDNRKDCLKNLKTNQPDIIFLDYNMRPFDGLEMMKEIKTLYPNIYLLMISGQTDMQVAISALKYGAFDYIIKDENEIETIKKVTNNIITMMKPADYNNAYNTQQATN